MNCLFRDDYDLVSNGLVGFPEVPESPKCFYGLQSLQGTYPAEIASSLDVKSAVQFLQL